MPRVRGRLGSGGIFQSFRERTITRGDSDWPIRRNSYESDWYDPQRSNDWVSLIFCNLIPRLRYKSRQADSTRLLLSTRKVCFRLFSKRLSNWWSRFESLDWSTGEAGIHWLVLGITLFSESGFFVSYFPLISELHFTLVASVGWGKIWTRWLVRVSFCGVRVLSVFLVRNSASVRRGLRFPSLGFCFKRVLELRLFVVFSISVTTSQRNADVMWFDTSQVFAVAFQSRHLLALSVLRTAVSDSTVFIVKHTFWNLS